MKKTLENQQSHTVSTDSAPGGIEAPRGASIPPGAGGRELRFVAPCDPEVTEKVVRRAYTAKYKLQILKEADTLLQPGQIGALLRREGLYSSNLTTWRRQREQGLLKTMSPRKRGRKQKEINPLARRLAQLEKENHLLRQKLKKAENIIDVQKKISEILSIDQDLQMIAGNR